ncbi:MAG: isoprenylcysteine carboxylmethyltransferase family protein [Gemmatimonadaceae bacterium]
MNQKTVSLVATLFLVAAILVLLISHNLVAKVPIGMALQIAAAALMVWARFTFGMRSFHAAANPTQGGLVTHGPYRYWRHPIYAAVLLFVWTGVLSQGRAPTFQAIALALAATLMTSVRISAEEQLLKGMFPDYPAYSARTKRLIPFLF